MGWGGGGGEQLLDQWVSGVGAWVGGGGGVGGNCWINGWVGGGGGNCLDQWGGGGIVGSMGGGGGGGGEVGLTKKHPLLILKGGRGSVSYDIWISL